DRGLGDLGGRPADRAAAPLVRLARDPGRHPAAVCDLLHTRLHLLGLDSGRRRAARLEARQLADHARNSSRIAADRRGAGRTSIVVWATSAVALRTGLLPRWFGWLGILVGILQLFAIFFIPAFIYWGWILVAAVLLVWRPGSSRITPVTPAG